MPFVFRFADGHADLDAQGLEEIVEIAASFEGRPDVVHIRAEGHTDWCAEEPNDLRLPNARAEAVAAALAAAGFPRDRIMTVGYLRSERSPCSCPPPGVEHTGLRAEISLLICRARVRATSSSDLRSLGRGLSAPDPQPRPPTSGAVGSSTDG